MTADEFNEKYKDYLEDRFDGMEIEDSGIIALCDDYFQKWIKIPGFKYYQIKTKFGTSRVYCDPYKDINTYDLEKEIDEILREYRDGK